MSNRMKPRNRRLVALTVGLATLAAATARIAFMSPNCFDNSR